MNLNLFLRLFATIAILIPGFLKADETNKFPAQPRIPYLTAAEQAKMFVLPMGYKMELVVGDPDIREPVAVAFDGDGRMYVAEMRTYMQDVDGKDELLNKSCVSLHWSSKRNGVFDKHTVFADNLILPRNILPVADGVLLNETDSNDIWLYRDPNNDGVADNKIKVYEGGKRGGNLEHQPSGLMWNLDNWLYTTLNDYRLRFDGGTNMIKESTESNSGQWGLSHDDYGKPWFVNASGEFGPLHFQQPYIYGRFTIKGELVGTYKEAWPLVGIADVQGGESRFRPSDKTLNYLTAACGPEIFRGDRLPEDLRGDLLFCEPVGRMVRRSKIEVKDGVTYLTNPYDKAEFIRSRDPNFRPVNVYNAPDGTLYVVDMYRGIIQEGNWVKDDSYLRKVVKQYELDKNFGRGRIWRLVHDDFKPARAPNLQNAKPSRLVDDLDHPNGWYRDTAQKLIILKKDKSVVPSLVRMAKKDKNHLARIHAIWTLEGLGTLDSSLLREKLHDEHPQVRIAAIRASETLLKKGDVSLESAIKSLVSDKDSSVVIQVMMTANRLKWKDSSQFINNLIVGHPSLGVREIGGQILTPTAGEERDFTVAQKAVLKRGANIYNELCFACHGEHGRGVPKEGAEKGITIAPPLAKSKTVTGLSDGFLNVLLKGLSGPVENKTYDSPMMPMESNDDEWIAAVSSYVRNNFGNNASFISTNDVARVRSAYKERTLAWTVNELQTVTPSYLTNRGLWKVSASHKTDIAANAVDDKLDTRYDTNLEQAPGMWFQVELPAETNIAGVYLDCATSPRDYPRGYKVEVSNDGKDWGKPVATGTGDARTTEIQFTPLKTKFVRITLTETLKGFWWSIHDLHLLQAPDAAAVSTAKSKKGDTVAFE